METTVAGCLVLKEATSERGHGRDSRPGNVCDLAALTPPPHCRCFPAQCLAIYIKKIPTHTHTHTHRGTVLTRREMVMLTLSWMVKQTDGCGIPLPHWSALSDQTHASWPRPGQPARKEMRGVAGWRWRCRLRLREDELGCVCVGGVLMWNAIHSLCHISPNSWVADALAPRGRGGGAGRWGELKAGHLEAREICGAAAGRNVIETHWEGFQAPPQKSRRLLSADLSHLCTHGTHVLTHPPVTPSSHRVTAMLALPFFLRVMSSPSCSVIFSPPPLSSFPEENASPVAPPVTVRRLNNLFHVWLTFRVSVVPGGFQEFQPLHPQQWRHLRECRRLQKPTLPEISFHLEGTGTLVSCEGGKTRKGRRAADEARSELLCKNSRAWADTIGRVMMTERMKEQESAREERKESQSEKSAGSNN